MIDNLKSLSYAIQPVLEQGEGFEVDILFNHFLSTTYRINFHDIIGEHETVLNIKYFSVLRNLIIQEVFLENRRAGTFTRILDIIKSWAKDHYIPIVTIESIITPEMASCALKNGFVIQESSGMYLPDSNGNLFFSGNYIWRS
jgi:hypothetical protein